MAPYHLDPLAGPTVRLEGSTVALVNETGDAEFGEVMVLGMPRERKYQLQYSYYGRTTRAVDLALVGCHIGQLT